MRIQEILDHSANGEYVVTLSVFPKRIEGVSVDIVIPGEDWWGLSLSDLADKYIRPALEIIQRHEAAKTGGEPQLVKRTEAHAG